MNLLKKVYVNINIFMKVTLSYRYFSFTKNLVKRVPSFYTFASLCAGLTDFRFCYLFSAFSSLQ